MTLIIDTREQAPLEFPKVEGVTVKRETMKTGDYTAKHTLKNGVEQLDSTVCERKSISDLFSSFTRNYEQEKKKWERAQAWNLQYILAIEGTVSEVLAGHTYWKAGEVHEAKKSGLAQLRQLCTIERKYGIQVQFFESRKAMALWIVEFFLAQERISTIERLP